MEVSTLTITGQTNLRKHGARLLDILNFLQKKQKENPNFLKNTDVRFLAKCYTSYVQSKGDSVALSSVHNTIIRAIRRNLIVRMATGNARKSNFRINYLHPGIPRSLLDNMSNEEKEFVKSINDRVQQEKAKGENVKLDGATETIVTKPKKETYEELKARTEKEKGEEPKEEPKEKPKEKLEEKPKEKLEEEPKEEHKKSFGPNEIANLAALVAMVNQAQPQPQPIAQPIAQPVEVKKEGNNLSLMINLNGIA